MGAEYLNYIRYPNDELSVVPYPYPDDYDLSELYLSIGGAVPYVFPIKEQTNYPEGVTFEDIFVVMCDFFYQVNLYDFANKDTMKGIQLYMNNISQFSDNTIDVYSSFTSDKYFYEPIYSISNYYIILKNFIWYENFDLKEYVNMFESLKNDFIIYGLDNEEFYDNNGPVKDLGEN